MCMLPHPARCVCVYVFEIDSCYAVQAGWELGPQLREAETGEIP